MGVGGWGGGGGVMGTLEIAQYRIALVPAPKTYRGVNNEKRGLDSSGKMAAVLGHFCSRQARVFSQRPKMLSIIV